MHHLVVNRRNHMGDCMCQMRVLKEYKENNPHTTYDFLTDNYLHCYIALHTDLFENIRLLPIQTLDEMVRNVDPKSIIEFDISWQRACEIGILKAWGEKTLGFIPSTDKPYFNLQPEERIVAKGHADMLRKRFRKLVVLQFNTPSGYVRSFQEGHWDKLLSMFPDDVALIYPGPIDLASRSPMTPRPNLVLLPGYDIGNTAALIKEADYVFGAHGGTIMLAHAVDQKNVTQIMFLSACHPNILQVPEWDTLCYQSHEEVNWEEIQQTIERRLLDK